MDFQRKPVHWGFLFITLGIIWLLNNLKIVQVDIVRVILIYWPVLLIIWGIGAITQGLDNEYNGKQKKRFLSGAFLTGIILVVAGAAILGRNIGLYYFNFTILWQAFWPVVLIFIGWNLFRGTSSVGRTHWAVMSGIDMKNSEWKVQSGNYIAFMGGVDLDLTAAEIPEQEIFLNLTAVMGGIKIKVPPEPGIEFDATAFLGGVKFLQEESGGIFASRTFVYEGETGTKRKLIITGRAMMGGIEIVR